MDTMGPMSRRSASLEPDRRAGQLPQIVRPWTTKPPPRRAEAIILADSTWRAARNIKVYDILRADNCLNWQNLYPPRDDHERTPRQVQEHWDNNCRGIIAGFQVRTGWRETPEWVRGFGWPHLYPIFMVPATELDNCPNVPGLGRNAVFARVAALRAALNLEPLARPLGAPGWISRPLLPLHEVMALNRPFAPNGVLGQDAVTAPLAAFGPLFDTGI
jgi:hypothetical protein